MTKKEIAVSLFKNGHNCAQSVVCAYAKDYGLSSEEAFRIAEGFGGGLGGSGLVCGALSGMVMVASLAKCPKKDLENPTKKDTYEVVSKMVESFRKKHGYMNCIDLLNNKNTTLIDGKKAICVECVEDCCNLIEEYIYD